MDGARFAKFCKDCGLLDRRLTTTEVDRIYDEGIQAGALGGKLLGAGGGGFMVFVVRPEDQPRVKARLTNLIHVSFEFETGGSKIAVFEPESPSHG